MAGFPKTEREARARSRRKLKALKRHAQDLLVGARGVAAFWDQGPVSSDIDQLLDDIDAGIAAIEESMDDEIDRHEEEWT